MIYIAGKFTAKDRLREERDRLRKLGYVVTSGWLEEPETDYTADAAYKVECAKRDLDEVVRAKTLIIDTLDVSDTGGREVEFGVALGNCDQIYVVGPLRNVFHYLVPERCHFDSWDALIEDFS